MRLDAFAAGARINPVVHIPDGYLSPVISVGLSVATVPAWAVATQKVKKVLDDRTVPLLAMFSALSFTIMMFNIPVPGGTTAHGVGGTLIAVVLGPWAAVIAVSTALIIQALFFGDGGILAIFANCLNMGVILPVVGYATYRLLAGKSPLLSSRRVWAAGIGSYVGITAAALAVGVELGIQPLLFTDHGHALYSPYGLAEAVPAMLVAHALGASIVEALITALGLAYLQQRHPEYLTSLKAAVVGGAPEEGESARPPRRTVLAAVGAVVSILAAIGLAEGGGDPRRLFGADWAAVDWPSVAIMLLVTGVIGLVLVPLAYLVLPGRLKRVGAGFAALAVISPLGLIAPGFAYGEGSAHEVQAAFGYVPKGLSDLSALFSAPLAGYEVPLPFLSGANGQLWRAGLGYELAGIVGILLVGGGALAIARLLAGRQAAAPQVPASGAAHPPAVATEARISWLEQTLGGITGSIEHAVFTEEHSRTPAFLQRRIRGPSSRCSWPWSSPQA